MRTVFVLEYKDIDSKGREKNATHVGVFSSVDKLEEAKSNIISQLGSKISFQVYDSETVY